MVDSQHQTQLQKEEDYWKRVIVRVIECVRFLAERGLAFRGDSHEIGSPNNGNFLGVLELLAKFDDILADHIARYGNQGRGNPSYLSHTVMEEVIAILASKVKATILSSILDAKYFSLIVDSTPDVSHIDQLTLVIRYIENVKPVERFLGYTPIKSHKSESLAARILSTMESLGLDINMCRGQSYDNASNMSGKYTSVQARIGEINQCAPYVPCAAHSLNLVGNSAAECCLAAVSFFSIVAEIYRFFVASTYRWDILKAKLANKGLVVKKLSDTRWSARQDAVKALAKGPNAIKASLDHLASDEDQTLVTRNEAASISEKINSLEFGFMVLFWHDLLDRIHKTNVSLQTIDISLSCVVDLFSSLQSFISEMRSRETFHRYLEKAKSFTQYTYQEFKDEMRRKRKRKKASDESSATAVELSGPDNFYVNAFLCIIDSLQSELTRRKGAYEVINERFD